MQAVRDRLASGNVVAARSLFFAFFENYIKPGLGYPAIGLAFGRGTYRHGGSETVDGRVLIRPVCWQTVPVDAEELVIGDDGLLALAGKVTKSLDGERLGLAMIEDAKVIGIDPIQVFRTDNNLWLVKQPLTVAYELNFARTDR